MGALSHPPPHQGRPPPEETARGGAPGPAPCLPRPASRGRVGRRSLCVGRHESGRGTRSFWPAWRPAVSMALSRWMWSTMARTSPSAPRSAAIAQRVSPSCRRSRRGWARACRPRSVATEPAPRKTPTASASTSEARKTTSAAATGQPHLAARRGRARRATGPDGCGRGGWRHGAHRDLLGKWRCLDCCRSFRACLSVTTDSRSDASGIRSIRRSIEHVYDVRAPVRTNQAPRRTFVRRVSLRETRPPDGASASAGPSPGDPHR